MVTPTSAMSNLGGERPNMIPQFAINCDYDGPVENNEDEIIQSN